MEIMHTSAQSTLMEQIDRMTVDDKIDDQKNFDDFSDYLTDTPTALVEFAQWIDELPGGLTNERVVVLFDWATRMGMKDISLQLDGDGDFNIFYQDENNATHPLVQLSSPQDSYRTVADVPSPDKHAYQEVIAVEENWSQLGLHAPIVRVNFSGQTEDDRGNILGSHEEDRYQWDGTKDLFALSLDERNSACIHDNYESDQLREGDQAHEIAADWEGPFAVVATLYRPNQELRALRAAVRLTQTTPVVSSRMRGPRL
jgi:hypothetical protein